MAFFDNSLLLSNAQTLHSTTAASTSIYDVTGAGSGNATGLIIGNATVFGADIGLGEGVVSPFVLMTVTEAGVSGGGATLQVAIQAAIDNGSNAPGSYTTISQTGTFTASQLTLGATLLLPIPKITIAEALPRFYRVNYIIGTSTFSALAVTTVILLNPPSGLTSTLYASNFASV